MWHELFSVKKNGLSRKYPPSQNIWSVTRIGVQKGWYLVIIQSLWNHFSLDYHTRTGCHRGNRSGTRGSRGPGDGLETGRRQVSLSPTPNQCPSPSPGLQEYGFCLYVAARVEEDFSGLLHGWLRNRWPCCAAGKKRPKNAKWVTMKSTWQKILILIIILS